MKILIVEDSVKMREMIKNVLTNCVTEFFECCDGIKALNAYAKYQPDWVLMDIRMKEMDGIRATQQIMTDFPHAKVLMVTNYDEPSLRKEAKEAGACGYILKDNLLKIRRFIHL